MNPAAIESVVLPFYRLGLTVNATTTPTEVLGRVLAEDFRSVSSQGEKGRAALIGQLEGFWRLIPDLCFEVQDVVSSGDKVVVRCVATGTPRGPFLGIETDGTRSFRIDTIDIHELRDGRVVRVHHVEDWAAAIRQVRA